MTLSNRLTLSRIVAVPFFILFMSLNGLYAKIIALVIFVFAALTDLYDGYLARRFGQVTKMGQFLDPLADKMIVSAALISFIRFEELSIYVWIVIVIIAREFIINDLRDFAITNNVIIAVTKAGKLKTIIQMVSIIVILSLIVIRSIINGAGWFDLLLRETVFWTVILVMFATVITGLDYLIRGTKELLKKRLFNDR